MNLACVFTAAAAPALKSLQLKARGASLGSVNPDRPGSIGGRSPTCQFGILSKNITPRRRHERVRKVSLKLNRRGW